MSGQKNTNLSAGDLVTQQLAGAISGEITTRRRPRDRLRQRAPRVRQPRRRRLRSLGHLRRFEPDAADHVHQEDPAHPRGHRLAEPARQRADHLDRRLAARAAVRAAVRPARRPGSLVRNPPRRLLRRRRSARAAARRRVPETVRDVYVAIFGDVPEEDVRSKLRITEGRKFDFYKWQQDRDRLQELFIERGYYEAHITARRDPSTPTAEADLVHARRSRVHDRRRRPHTRSKSPASRPGLAPQALVQAWADTPIDALLADEFDGLLKPWLAKEGYLAEGRSRRDHAMTAARPEPGRHRSEAVATVTVTPGRGRPTGSWPSRATPPSSRRCSTKRSLPPACAIGYGAPDRRAGGRRLGLPRSRLPRREGDGLASALPGQPCRAAGRDHRRCSITSAR